MKIVLLAVIVATALASASTAAASRWPTDPRVCGGSVLLPQAQCVAGAAETAVVRQYSATHTFMSFKCQTVGPLKAKCPTSSGAGQITYTVVFSKSKGRWWVKATPSS